MRSTLTNVAPVRTTTRHYAVAGIVLRTELEFPGLPEGPPTPVGWTLRLGAGAPPNVPVTPLGEQAHGAERYLLGWTPGGYRLDHTRAGWFDLGFEDSSITWYKRDGSPDDLARATVLGPVLALALERNGALCLHGSCVVIKGQAVAFLGSIQSGKSTLALGLVTSGARWLSDDLIAVTPGALGKAASRVRPGIPSFVTDRMWQGQAPLGAVYILDPVAADASEACRREPLSGVDAVTTLAHETQLASSLVGLRAAGAHLRLAGEVAATAPLWRLQIARDLARLPAVLEQLGEWHR